MKQDICHFTNFRFDENKISFFYFNCIVSLLLINLAWQSTRNNIHNMFTSNSRGWDGSPVIRLLYFSCAALFLDFEPLKSNSFPKKLFTEIHKIHRNKFSLRNLPFFNNFSSEFNSPHMFNDNIL